MEDYTSLRMGVGIVLFVITPSDTLGGICASHIHNSVFFRFGVLDSKIASVFTRRHTGAPLNFNLWLLPDYF